MTDARASLVRSGEQARGRVAAFYWNLVGKKVVFAATEGLRT